MANKKRNWWGVGLMLMLLALFPIMSYIYMKKGFDYQVQARSELKDLGPVLNLPDTTFFGDTLVGQKMGKQVALLAYFDPSNQETLKYTGKYLSEIHEQFDDVAWFRMELLVPQDKQEVLTGYREEMKMQDPNQVFFYKTNENQLGINRDLHIEEGLRGRDNCVALADTNGVVVNYYDLSDGKQFVRLVEHIAMLRPAEKKPKALFRREREM